MKKLLPISNLNLLWNSLRQLPLVQTLLPWEQSLTLTWLHPPVRKLQRMRRHPLSILFPRLSPFPAPSASPGAPARSPAPFPALDTFPQCLSYQEGPRGVPKTGGAPAVPSWDRPGATGLLPTWAHVEPPLTNTPMAFPAPLPHPGVLHGAVVTQGQGLALGLGDPYATGLSTLIQSIPIPPQNLAAPGVFLHSREGMLSSVRSSCGTCMLV